MLRAGLLVGIAAGMLAAFAVPAAGEPPSPAVTAAGRCVQGDCRNGIGMARLPEDRLYIGQWRGGRPNGAGFLIYSPDRPEQRAVYEGMVRDGKREGEGRMFFPDGAAYAGGFHDDRYEGYGRFSFADGSRYEGTFRAGRYDGYGVYTFASGRTKEGYWRNGRFVRELRLRERGGPAVGKEAPGAEQGAR